MRTYDRKGGIDFTGTPDHVAGMMQEIMEEVGGDGFLLFNGYFDRRYIMEVCDGLVPELQRRGLTRKALRAQALQGQSDGVLALRDLWNASMLILVILSAAKDLAERSNTGRAAGVRSFAALRTTGGSFAFTHSTVVPTRGRRGHSSEA